MRNAAIARIADALEVTSHSLQDATPAYMERAMKWILLAPVARFVIAMHELEEGETQLSLQAVQAIALADPSELLARAIPMLLDLWDDVEDEDEGDGAGAMAVEETGGGGGGGARAAEDGGDDRDNRYEHQELMVQFPELDSGSIDALTEDEIDERRWERRRQQRLDDLRAMRPYELEMEMNAYTTFSDARRMATVARPKAVVYATIFSGAHATTLNVWRAFVWYCGVANPFNMTHSAMADHLGVTDAFSMPEEDVRNTVCWSMSPLFCFHFVSCQRTSL